MTQLSHGAKRAAILTKRGVNTNSHVKNPFNKEGLAMTDVQSLKLDDKASQLLQEFVVRLKSQSPLTNFVLQVQAWPNEREKTHSLVLQVANPLFQFYVEAAGEDLPQVLSTLEQTFSDEVAQRKLQILFKAEGIDSRSPFFTRYFH